MLQGVLNQASLFENQWETTGDNYFARIIGNEDLEKQAIQQLFNGFFYVDLQGNNQKLAAPTGLDPKYSPESPNACLDRAEFLLADFSREAIDINMQAMMDMFFGPGRDRLGGLS